MLRLYIIGRPKTVPRGGVLFLFYHDVKPFEQERFQRQVQMLQSVGKLIGLDEALGVLENGADDEARICLTFDDGYKGAFDYALPILADNKVAAAFFVVPRWIDERRPGIMSWDDCRHLDSLGMDVVSHGLTHKRLRSSDTGSVTAELILSRQRIESEIGRPCYHFACPWGQPGADYHPEREPALARAAGYRSFFTTIPHRAYFGTDPWAIPRVRMEPSWGVREIKYALSRS